MARHIATLPMRLGGLGLRAATRTAPGAFWVSWADVLHMIDKRRFGPKWFRRTTNMGRVARWRETSLLFFLSAPSQVSGSMCGSTTRLSLPNSTFGRRGTCSVVPTHSGPASCAVLHGARTGPEFKLAPDLFRTLVLERMRLPLPMSEAHCECGLPLDVQGRHRAACPRSGRLKSRAQAPERTLARVCREAGATVRFDAMSRDMNIAVAATDFCAIEVLASGLPLHHGVQMAVDITIRCAHTAESRACPNAATMNGAVLQAARAQKATKYAELLHGDRCRLVVVGMETGGRWSDEAMQFIAELAACQGSTSSDAVQHVLGLAMALDEDDRHLLVAHSLVSSKGSTPGSDGPTPDLADLFGEV